MSKKGSSGGTASGPGEVERECTGPGAMSRTIQIPVEHLFDEIHVPKSASIRVSSPGRTAFAVPLNGSELMMGRDENCDLPLTISSVSWHHARIVRENEDFAVEDMDSTNGTFVNNVRVSRCILHNNDVIQAGEASIVFTRHVSKQ